MSSVFSWFGRVSLCAALIALALLWPPVALRAAGSELESQLSATLSNLPHTDAVCGACVIDLTSGQVVFARDADLSLVPASNTKVFVMAAALTELGPEFAFETALYTDANHLYLIGGGDPGLGDVKLCERSGETIYTAFERWAAVLIEAGLTRLPGDLVIDDTIFDNGLVHPSWEEGDLGKWYAAPVSGLNFNDNCIDITLTPSKQVGALVQVTKVPACDLVRIDNQCRSGGKGQPILHNPPGTFEYKITGRCNKEWPFPPVAFPDPSMLCADTLRGVLASKGVIVAGAIRTQRVRQPDGTLKVAVEPVGRRRTPLTKILNRVGKDSQNLFADCLLKMIGYQVLRQSGVADPQGSWPAGGRAIVEAIRRMGVDTTGLVVADGSGLSRDNRCTARQLAATLAWSHRHAHGPIMRDSLSIAGVDGSLRKRLRDRPDRVYGKTGTMRGVRTLSGYVTGPSNQGYAFAVLFNGYKGPSTPYREIQDRFCRRLIEDLDRRQ